MKFEPLLQSKSALCKNQKTELMKRSVSNYLLLFGAITIFSITAPGCKSKTKDADVKASVESALNANPQTAGVMVDVKDGVATLSGQVSNASAQSNAETIARGVKGVKSVQNNLSIASAPVQITPDDPLMIGVRDATKDFPGVTATVNDGVITVTGEIKSADWKRLKMTLDGLKPKRVDASALKIS
jgi:hyperosmotically inducible periplasmic protein